MEKIYKSIDGKLFNTERECYEHESKLSSWANGMLKQYCMYFNTMSGFVGYGYCDSTVFVIQITAQNIGTLNKALKVLDCQELDRKTIGTIQLIGVTSDGECAYLMDTMAEFCQQMINRYNRQVEGRIK